MRRCSGRSFQSKRISGAVMPLSWVQGGGIAMIDGNVVICDQCPCDAEFCPALKYTAQVDCQDLLLTKMFTMDVPKIGSGNYGGVKTIDGTDESPPPNTNEWEVTLTATCIDGYVTRISIVFRNNPSPVYQFGYGAEFGSWSSSDTGWVNITPRVPMFAGSKCLVRLTS